MQLTIICKQPVSQSSFSEVQLNRSRWLAITVITLTPSREAVPTPNLLKTN